jgi:hypothetical protein
MDPTDFEYGEREYNAEDPAGHRWTFSETLADVAPEEWGRGIPSSDDRWVGAEQTRAVVVAEQDGQRCGRQCGMGGQAIAVWPSSYDTEPGLVVVFVSSSGVGQSVGSPR